MARTVSWDELRELAAFRAEKGCAISVYLGLDPSVAATAGDVRTRVNSLLDEAAKSDAATDDALTHDEKQGIRADLERIRRFLEHELDRDGAHGVALFCAGLDGLWQAIPLVAAVRDEVHVDRRLRVAPLVALVGRGDGALVVMLSREQGRFFRLRAGQLEEVTDMSDEQPRRHDQGGWSQARFQRHVDKLASEHLREVAEHLDKLVRRSHGGLQVVVAAPEETWAEFQTLVSHEVERAVAGWTAAEAHATPAELREVAAGVLERARAERERELLDRWREGAGRNGRATGGWDETLSAASDARVETLVVSAAGADRHAWSCPECGRASAEAGECPLDGTPMRARDSGRDLAVQQTLVHGGTVWVVEHAPDLDPVGGIGALLRF
ncbi:MAG: hypothetical protein ICV74_09655 [Thermoleophilia bacterium]|nr:hypothetical protein [Thermoleophilia bacterium]